MLATALVLAGCGGKFVHVRTGDDPRYQDEGVRFRTTYYFRVFDPCGSTACKPEDEKAGLCRPKNDSLYRFRLTGKAGALASVHFEAGTLMAHEIDPFGTQVAYDEASNRFQFKSRHQSEDEARKRELFAEIRTLRTLCAELKAEQEPASKCVAVLTAKVEALQARTNGSATASTPTGSKETTPASYPVKRNPTCSPGEERRQGFQILGPEGWRTFDQDERLILAMSSSGKPLIATLKEISDRVLQQKSPSRPLEAYLREQTAVERARQALDGAASEEGLEALWQKVRSEMEREEP